MRAIWTGAISFGLVNIGVSLLSAEEPDELSFNLMDVNDHARIRYQRINADTGKEVEWNDIVKSYEFPDGSYVIVSDDDFAKADPKAAKTIDIEAFISEDDLNPMYLEKPYYLQPDKKAEKAFVLIRDAMKKTRTVGIGRVTIRTKQSLCAVMPCENGLVLNVMRYASELRDMDALKLPEGVKTTAKEMELAVNLIDSLKTKWNPDDYKDQYTDALLARLEAKAKLKGKELPDVGDKEETEPAKVLDLMELLKQSVDAKAKRSKTGTKAAPPGKAKSGAKPKKKTS